MCTVCTSSHQHLHPLLAWFAPVDPSCSFKTEPGDKWLTFRRIEERLTYQLVIDVLEKFGDDNLEKSWRMTWSSAKWSVRTTAISRDNFQYLWTINRFLRRCVDHYRGDPTSLLHRNKSLENYEKRLSEMIPQNKSADRNKSAVTPERCHKISGSPIIMIFGTLLCMTP